MAVCLRVPFFFCMLLAFFTAASSVSQLAPAPAVDCSTLVLTMLDCLSFVTEDSNLTKPEGQCCAGLKNVLKTKAECLCETFKNSAQLGVKLNVSKAETLPAACSVSAPSLSNCGLSIGSGAAPVSVVSRFMQSPTKQHFGAAKRILRYVAGTVDLGIWYSKAMSFKLNGFTDSDWAGCLDDRRSTSGNAFSLGSGAVTWSSKKQETIALSSSEAEYTAASSAARQVLWLRKLLSDLGFEQKEATEIFCDNMSTIAMSKNPAFHGRTKHIDVQHHFIRELVTNQKIMLKFCGTNEQTADIFTKSLPQAKHQFFMSQLGVCNFESRGSVD